MSGIEGKSGKYIRTKPPWNKGKKCPQTSMERNGSWKGGRILRGEYISIKIPDHPNADSQGYVKEHRLVMEKHLGRILLESEVVHHINSDRQDNKIENLMLYSNHSIHMIDHNAGKESHKVILVCDLCGSEKLVYPHIAKKQKFCSILCSNRSKDKKPWKRRKVI
mgnify:CR=1 FL=1